MLVSGIFNDRTTGAPLTILFENKNTRSSDYEKTKDIYRPGHADFVAEKKYKGFQDYRGGGHFSGRLTLLLVAAGTAVAGTGGTAGVLSAGVGFGKLAAPGVLSGYTVGT